MTVSDPSLEDVEKAGAPALLSTASPETGRTLNRSVLIRFGIGFFCISLLWAIGLATVASVLLPQRLKDIGVDNPDAMLGTINAVTAIVSLVSNLVFGNLSDRTRSRFGRRTPWIVLGGIVGGLGLFGVGMFASPVILAFSYCISMVGLNMMLAPAVAVLSDRVPESVRGTMSTFWGVGVTIGYPLGAIVGARFLSDSGASISGFVLGGILMGVAGIAAAIVWPRERSAADLPSGAQSFGEIARSFIPPTKDCGDFYKAFFGRFTMLLSYQMIMAYQLYIIQDYLGVSTADSAAVITLVSSITLVVALVGGFASGPISDLLKRRKLPVVVASLLFAVGVAMLWLIPTVTGMLLFAGIAGLGYAIYSSVDQALNVDVLPNPETAGKDLGILNMSTTLGQMCGPIITSLIVTSTGSYALAFPVSIVSAVVGCVSIMAIKRVR